MRNRDIVLILWAVLCGLAIEPLWLSVMASFAGAALIVFGWK